MVLDVDGEGEALILTKKEVGNEKQMGLLVRHNPVNPGDTLFLNWDCQGG